tara:strand:- start:1942 stop:2637 length:696 start_codon:yes stop_codon:yes gene_type:complete
MATIKEIVYDIKNLIRGGQQSDDEIISDRQIEFQIDSLRAQFIRQDINKRRSVSDNIKQVIPALSLISVPAATVGVSMDGNILRSVNKIPNAIETAHSDLITAVGPSGILSVNFHVIPYSRVPWAGSNRYTKKMQFAFILDSYIYVIGPDIEFINFIKVEGVWQNPRDISNYMSGDNALAYDPDIHDYPLSTSMLDMIKQAMLSQNMKPFIETLTDSSNNSKSDLQPNQQK